MSAFEEGGFIASTLPWIALSVGTSVTVVLANKAVFSHFRVSCVTSLTALHFLFSTMALGLCHRLGIFEKKSMPIRETLEVAVAGVGSIIFMNLSLDSNSVGTYQMFKLLIIPVLMVIETHRGIKVYHRKKKFALCFVVGGVGAATLTDVSLNFVGLLFGVGAVLSTCQFQMWQGGRAKEFEMSPLQMVHSMAKYQFVMAAACAIPMDWSGSDGGIHEAEMDTTGFFLLLTSCTFAVGSYFASFGLIGKTSPVTYQVIGHMKTCSILLGGYMLFPVTSDWFQVFKNLFGVLIALFGAVLYGHLSMERAEGEKDWIDLYAGPAIREQLCDDYVPIPAVCFDQHGNVISVDGQPAVVQAPGATEGGSVPVLETPKSPKFQAIEDPEVQKGGSIL